jgi:hypothetical protein
MGQEHAEEICAHLRGKVGEYVYRHYPGLGTQRVPYYRPTNPRTAAQQLMRKVFADATAAWQALSEEEKDEWREKAKQEGQVGAHLFQGHYLETHEPYYGTAKVNFAVIGGDWVD